MASPGGLRVAPSRFAFDHFLSTVCCPARHSCSVDFATRFAHSSVAYTLCPLSRGC